MKWHLNRSILLVHLTLFSEGFSDNRDPITPCSSRATQAHFCICHFSFFLISSGDLSDVRTFVFCVIASCQLEVAVVGVVISDWLILSLEHKERKTNNHCNVSSFMRVNVHYRNPETFFCLNVWCLLQK